MVGLLFQPRRRPANTRAVEAVPDVDVPGDRRHVFQLALEATMLGDTSRFADYFTDDLRLTSPHVEVTTRDAAQRAFGGGDDALSCMAIVVHAIDVVRDTAYAEWRLDAKFSAPLLFDDDLLIEPTGGAVRLRGASVAEFRGLRIAVCRHYFDDSELLDGLPGVPAHVRWVPSDLPGSSA